MSLCLVIYSLRLVDTYADYVGVTLTFNIFWKYMFTLRRILKTCIFKIKTNNGFTFKIITQFLGGFYTTTRPKVQKNMITGPKVFHTNRKRVDIKPFLIQEDDLSYFYYRFAGRASSSEVQQRRPYSASILQGTYASKIPLNKGGYRGAASPWERY